MISQDAYLTECFPLPPLTALTKQHNLRNFLIKSKLPPPPGRYPKRHIKGMKKCEKSCTACPYINEGNEDKVNQYFTWRIERIMTCESCDVVCILDCQKCRKKIHWIHNLPTEAQSGRPLWLHFQPGYQ